MPTHIDSRGWRCLLASRDAWHLLLGDGDDGPEVWRSSRDRLWRVRYWLGGICVGVSGPCATKLDAQDNALDGLLGAGLELRHRERPGRAQDLQLDRSARSSAAVLG